MSSSQTNLSQTCMLLDLKVFEFQPLPCMISYLYGEKMGRVDSSVSSGSNMARVWPKHPGILS